MEETECSETSAYKIQTPENYPEENIQHTEHCESLKSRAFHKILSWGVLGKKNCPAISIFLHMGQF